MTHSTNKVTTKQTGHTGEIIARDFLIRNGYSILVTNWTARNAEIDIVAEKDGSIVFIEVKYRRSDRAGEAAYGFDRRKREKFFRAVGLYCLKYGIDPDTIRAELIAIDRLDNSHRITHHKNLGYES